MSKENLIIKDWSGRHIEFNHTMRDALTGDILLREPHDYLFLTYIGKEGCTGCKMKLNFWKKYMESLDTIDSEIAFLMVIHPDDSTLVHYMIERDNFDLPVYIDTYDRVNQANSFPSDDKFQSFLLDGSNNVIAIGNPTHSPKIGDYYSDIITGKKLISPHDQTSVTVPVNHISFNDVEFGDTLKCKFTIENSGPEEIHIDEILTSCDCTVATTDTYSIPSKHKGEISVISVVENDSSDSFMRSVHVYLKEISTPVQLRLSGTVKK